MTHEEKQYLLVIEKTENEKEQLEGMHSCKHGLDTWTVEGIVQNMDGTHVLDP